MPFPLLGLEEGPKKKKLKQASTTKVKLQRLDLSAAIGVSLPSRLKELQPAGCHTPDGRTGWVPRLPGGAES